MRRLQSGLFTLAMVLGFAGCAHPRATPSAGAAPALQGDSAHPGHTQGWVDTTLYFGLGPVDHPEQGISESDWRAFLDREVTPRFPSGLSVVDVYGQWQGKGEQHVERLRSKMLILLHADTQENRDKIEAIRAAWKQKTGDESVLRVREAADVSF